MFYLKLFWLSLKEKLISSEATIELQMSFGPHVRPSACPSVCQLCFGKNTIFSATD